MPGERQAQIAMAEVLQRRREEIVRRWLECLERELGPCGLDQSQLRDAIPDYLVKIAEMLQAGASPQTDGGEMWAGIAQAHGVARVEQGFDIRDLMREFVLLRLVIVEVAREEKISFEAIFELITESIEDAIEQSVAAYVSSRDEQARHTEARHVAFLTHELRSPLGTAMLAMSQLCHHGAIAPEHERLAQIVTRSHLRLRDLIEGVLTLERGRAGELSAKAVPTNVGQLIAEAVQQVTPAAESKGLAIEADYDDDLVVALDPRLTASAIQNLIDNAVKYSDTGRVRVWLESGESDVSVHVCDSCGGVSREDLDMMFTPFRRGRHQRPGTGSGLGLAITREAVEAQGGSVEVEPIEGACHFWLRLPNRR
jgi:two-component system, OmpR family, phosphate regulon sensor histidine kinase PhoR